jgi:uncharacterized protein (DUF362 family)/Pyruvate/2-oxoacid:ferredoxin oxidoreductase delta subunit
MRAFVQPGQRVLLKPNLLGAFAVERAVTTHPAVVRAAILLVKEAGGIPLVGDSPAMGGLETVLRTCGLTAVLEETGARPLDLSTPHEFDVPQHLVSPRLTLARALLEVDVIVSLPKLKTHGQMTLTGALKNQYGLIPGALKSHWHFRLQEPPWLARLILDVNRVARPALTIMDAIVAMEGQGPTSGTPRRLGALLASSDLAAADTLSCHLIGQDPRRVPLLAAAQEHGFGQTDLAAIRIEGDDWRALCAPDFKKIDQLTDVLHMLPLPRPALNWVRQQWTLRPRIVDGRCTRCGICETGCPVTPSAIHPDNAPGERVEDDRCIRCYCCHEFCPSHGIELQRPWLARHLPLNALANGAGRVLGFLSSIRNHR